jgi:pseudouridine synthase
MSRTQAAARVRAGRVTVNGRRVLDPEHPSDPSRDCILLDGRPLRPARKLYLAMHKPLGTITSARDPEGRATVYDLLPPRSGSVQAVGRLDADSSGLLLFTNDTAFAAWVTDHASGVEKVYEARLEGRVEPSAARRFAEGIVLDGRRTLPARLKLLERSADSTLVEVALTEGRNRQVRRMWEGLGHRVLALKRIAIGPVRLGRLPPGKVRPLRERELAALVARSQLTKR